ncbi:MAG: AsmA family protein [Bryobacter sp.]|nr:AsmA family protein [Bryobacter sp.]
MKRAIRWLLVVLVLFLAALPRLTNGIFRGRMEVALEQALNRPARLEGPSYWRLLPFPAFVAEQVTIEEDPRFSLEPFAYVEEIAITPSWLALAQGKFLAARIRLNGPSLNLMRTADGWNVATVAGAAERMPEFEVRGGRINFKQGSEKSAFYLANVLADLGAKAGRREWEVFLEAEPARTDRGPQGFGKFSARGGVRLPAEGLESAEAVLDWDVELQPSALHAFNFFFGARGVDFAGKLSSRAHLHGPVSAVKIEGWTQLEELEAQSFLAFGGNRDRLNFAGELDLKGQTLKLDSAPNKFLGLRLRARDLFQAPRGGMLLEVREMEFAKLLDFARQANAKLPAEVAVQGSFNAVIGYTLRAGASALSTARGMVWFDDGELAWPQSPVLRVAGTRVVLEGDRWLLGATQIQSGERQTANVEGEWTASSGALRLAMATNELGVNELRSGLGAILSRGQLPLLEGAKNGSWQGALTYQRKEDTEAGTWRGRLRIRNTLLSLEGVAQPLEVLTAEALFTPSRVDVRRLRALWEGIEVEGACTYFPSSPRATEVDLRIGEMNVRAMQSFFAPAGEAAPGLLERMRLRRTLLPDWLRGRNVAGTISIRELAFAQARIAPLAGKLDWRGSALKLALAPTRLYWADSNVPVSLAGDFVWDLVRPALATRFEGELSNWETSEGPARWKGWLEFHLPGPQVWQGARADGELEIEARPEAPAKLLLREGRITIEDAGERRTLTPARYWPLPLREEP